MPSKINKETNWQRPSDGQDKTLHFDGDRLSICTAEVLAFFSRKDEQIVEDGCILWGCRVTSPTTDAI